jgi:hypothetical protein
MVCALLLPCKLPAPPVADAAAAPTADTSDDAMPVGATTPTGSSSLLLGLLPDDPLNPLLPDEPVPPLPDDPLFPDDGEPRPLLPDEPLPPLADEPLAPLDDFALTGVAIIFNGALPDDSLLLLSDDPFLLLPDEALFDDELLGDKPLTDDSLPPLAPLDVLVVVPAVCVLAVVTGDAMIFDTVVLAFVLVVLSWPDVVGCVVAAALVVTGEATIFTMLVAASVCCRVVGVESVVVVVVVFGHFNSVMYTVWQSRPLVM